MNFGLFVSFLHKMLSLLHHLLADWQYWLKLHLIHFSPWLMPFNWYNSGLAILSALWVCMCKIGHFCFKLWHCEYLDVVNTGCNHCFLLMNIVSKLPIYLWLLTLDLLLLLSSNISPSPLWQKKQMPSWQMQWQKTWR